MNIFQKTMIRLGLRRIAQQDVARGILERDVGLLRLIIRFGSFRDRRAAVLGLGKLRLKQSIPDLTRLLRDDFESVAQAAKQSLTAFLPDPKVAQQLEQAAIYRAYKTEQRSLKRKAVWYDTNNPLEPPAPMIDRSKMQMLARVKGQLQKSIRFW